MKQLLIPALISLGVLTLAAKAPKDPVLLEVDGRPVTLSEFEYFYHKNDGNEIEKETPEQYLQRFIDYKLKVAQARAEQRDTTADYRKDYASFRRDLAMPYMTDSATYENELQKSYEHTLTHRKVDHLMLALNQRALADSLRQALIDGADFESIVMQYSIDPSKSQNHGHYNWIGADQFPYEFEEIVYETPLNQISPIAQTTYGYHIVRPTESRPNRGDVHAAHILIKIDADTDSAAAKSRIDSIYNAIENGAAFEALARTLSDDPSSKKKDGDLGFFSRGKMVSEFENVAFSMDNNEVSKPFLTRFGWHIIKKYEERTISEYQAKQAIKENMKRDIRSVRPRIARAEQLKKEYNVHFDEAGHAKLVNAAAEVGYDSARVALLNDPSPLFFVADSTVTIADFLNEIVRLPNFGIPADNLNERLDSRMINAIMAYEDRQLYKKYPEFRRLVDEYAEGLMLVASLEENVWNRPSRDPEGLKEFFEANKQNYTFDSPRWKGYVIYATSDSLLGEIETYLRDHKPTADQLGDSIKGRYPSDVRIERIVLPKGENQIVDYIAFDGPKPVIKGRFKFFTTYMPRLIESAEEVADVRNRVTNDWTAKLEESFVEGLRAKYPVKVNKKVLKKVK